MNILIIEDTASSNKGGAEKSMRYFCEYLSKKESVNLYLVYHKDGNLTKKPESDTYKEIIKINLHPIKVVGLFTWIKSIFELVRYCRKHKIDLVFTHIIHAFLSLRIAKFFSGFKHLQYFKWTPSTKNIGKLGGWGLKGVDESFAVSKFTMAYWCDLNPKFNTNHVIPDGIPLSLNINVSKEKNIQSKSLKLLFIGRIYHGKGLHILIDAMTLIPHLDIHLSVCGNFGDEESVSLNDYHKLINEKVEKLQLNNKIDFLGLQSNIDEHINNSDLVIVPSVWPDAQPLVVLEAMQQGKLCIASRVGGIPEIYMDDLTSLMFEPNNPEGVAAKISEVLNYQPEEKSYFQDLLRNRFFTNYTLDNTNKSLLSKIKKLLDE